MHIHPTHEHPPARRPITPTGAQGPHEAGLDDRGRHGNELHGGQRPHGGESGHDRHAGHDPAAFRRKFWLAAALTVPVVASSSMVMDWFRYHLGGVGWVGPVLGTVIFAWGGQPFLVGAAAEVRARRPGMMLLISMAITVAWTASMASSLGWFDLEFWWELAALVTIMLLGHWQEMKAVGQARGALATLAALLPDHAELIGPDGATSLVGINDLAVGDRVLVRSGGRIPADGRIVDGETDVDESMISGESRPVGKAYGDRVVAGTVVVDSTVRIEVDAVGDGTALAGIQRLVADAQASSSNAQALADRFAALLFYVATAAAAATFLTWALLGDLPRAVESTVTVLVIACPHALGLAIPLVVAISTAMAARNGILVKDRQALERLRIVDAVAFDKTGTLTEGAHVVTEIAGAGRSVTDVLRLAGSVEGDSEHPVARAIVARASAAGSVPVATSFRSLTGRGVVADIDGVTYAVGGPALLRERGLTIPDTLAGPVARWMERGASVLHLVEGGAIIGSLALEDAVRPEAVAAVADLHRLGIANVMMITGDARQVAERVAAQVGIDEVLAEVLPEDKDDAVRALQARGLVVAMVGDGVNDAPALARADVGVAIGAGTDVAIESAGVVLASSDPRKVATAIRLSRAAYRKMIQNLVWAAGYNVVAIPLAAGALAWAGLTLSPAVGAILMSLSTIIVALNAQLLRRVELTPGLSSAGVEAGGTRGATRGA